MTYQETLDRIHSFQKFGSRLGLERMTRLMELLGNPQESMKVIHVAGTNGKGSVCRFLYSVLQENGYKVGLYTSPYLERFTERIEYNGSEIKEEELVRFTEAVLEKVELMLAEGMESPTEFELITAIAFLYFSEQEIDFLVLEVGLGGKGDSTNMVSRPAASVITSISFDHMDYLGDTLEKIAVEKAGIIKPDVPVIYNVEDEKAEAAIRGIADAAGSISFPVQSMSFEIREKSVEGSVFDTKINGEEYSRLAISMIGDHQIGNAICALTTLAVLQEKKLIKLDRDKLYNGFYKAKQTGRFEIIRKKPYLIIDGAHNEAGAEALKNALTEYFTGCRILMIVGMLADKKIDKILDQLETAADEFIATEPDNPRKLSADDLCSMIKKRGKKCTTMREPEDVCRHIDTVSASYDVVVFAGSLYLIGKVRGILNHEKAEGAAVL